TSRTLRTCSAATSASPTRASASTTAPRRTCGEPSCGPPASSEATRAPLASVVRRSTDRILTTFVGSIIRPPALRRLQNADRVNPDEYSETLRGAVAEAVRKQAEVGLDVVSDGEFGKSNWAGYILGRVSGFELRPVPAGAQVYNRFGREGDDFADFYSQNVVGEWSPRVL